MLLNRLLRCIVGPGGGGQVIRRSAQRSISYTVQERNNFGNGVFIQSLGQAASYLNFISSHYHGRQPLLVAIRDDGHDGFIYLR